MTTDARENNEKCLQRERETLEVTLKSIGDAVVVTYVTGRVTFLNRAAAGPLLIGVERDADARLVALVRLHIVLHPAGEEHQ